MNQLELPGMALRDRRLERGLSMMDVYEAIHVPVEYIEALEHGNFDAMPGAAYGLGFLRTYCEFLDLEPEPYTDQFRVCTRPAAAPRLRTAVITDSKARPRWLGDLVAWGTVCALLLLGWVTYSAVVRPLVESASPRVEATTERVSPPNHFEDGF